MKIKGCGLSIPKSQITKLIDAARDIKIMNLE